MPQKPGGLPAALQRAARALALLAPVLFLVVWSAAGDAEADQFVLRGFPLDFVALQFGLERAFFLLLGTLQLSVDGFARLLTLVRGRLRSVPRRCTGISGG